MKNNFERGLDPKESIGMGIFQGLRYDETFSTQEKWREKNGVASWEFKGRKVLHIEGLVTKTFAGFLWIELSDGDFLRLDYFNGSEGEIKHAIISVDHLNIYPGKSVTEWFQEYFDKTNSYILSTLKCYEDCVTGRIDDNEEDDELDESFNFERGEDPKLSMKVGRRPMIQAWLDEMGIVGAIINDDFTIDYPSSCNSIIDLSRKNIQILPEYIQFNEVYGGFNISENRLISLRGCPRIVRDTEYLFGNFKFYRNELSSLEYAPKIVEGNFIGYHNPGYFSKDEVEKICKVKGIINVDSVMMKESFQFHRNEEPKKSMDIGNTSRIIDWMNDHHIDRDLYRINSDGTITVFSDINLMGDPEIPNSVLTELPNFIRFDTIMGSFYAANNNFSSLDGFPKLIEGDFSIYSEIHGVKRWRESDIRRRITIKGTIWN